jgi:hypothetical protein
MSSVVTDILTGSAALGINLLAGAGAIYAIVDATSGSPIIVPDTMKVFGYKNSAEVSDYPIEQGSFSSYNKVKIPFEIRVIMCCGGLNLVQQAEQAIDTLINSALGTNLNQGMPRSAFCDALDAMIESLDTYTIVTPDKTYVSANCIRVSYDRTQRAGAGMIEAECIFKEIRQSVSAVYSNGGTPNVTSDSPDASNPVGTGTTTTVVPTAVQAAQIDATEFA